MTFTASCPSLLNLPDGTAEREREREREIHIDVLCSDGPIPKTVMLAELKHAWSLCVGGMALSREPVG